MRKLRRGFSLIELLVVVAIIAILAALALPMYQQYQAKAKINSAFLLAQSLLERVTIIFEQTGSFPGSVTFYNGNVINNQGGWTFAPAGGLPYQNIYDFVYNTSNVQGGSDALGALMGITITGLTYAGSGYLDPNGHGINAGNTIYIAVRDVNGATKFACGAWNASSMSAQTNTFAPQYMPAKCTCPNIVSFVTGPNVAGC